MKPLFSNFDYLNANSSDKLPCDCYYCHKTFLITKYKVQKALNNNERAKGMYCSSICRSLSKTKKQKIFCDNCGVEFMKHLNQINNTSKHFCSRSCAATYNNTHKSKGNVRSKLEQYLEKELTELYPNLLILFNNKTIINSELDIYVPSLKLAFELNGLFHYEPIFGQDKLNQIQNNDQRKFQACLEQGIELCIIDTSQQKYFKEQTSKKYLDIIIGVLGRTRTDTPEGTWF